MDSRLQAMPIQGPGVFADLNDAPVKVQKELGLARAIQNTLVPSVTYKNMHVEAYGQTIPQEEFGGDLVDLVAAGSDINDYVADVSGHGLPAGVLMGMVKTAVRYGLHLGQALPVLLDGLNRVLPAVKEPNMFATFAGLRFDVSTKRNTSVRNNVPLLQYRRRHKDIVRSSMVMRGNEGRNEAR